MYGDTTHRRTVLVIGSVPADDAEAAFRAVAGRLEPFLRRIPDGETGPRADWYAWQHKRFAAALGLRESISPNEVPGLPRFRRDGAAGTGDVQFDALGYAAAALASYPVFRRLRADGVLAGSIRFQVCVRTPATPISLFVDADDQPQVERAYEERLAFEMEEIFAAIPHRELAIQWDVDAELAMIDGSVPSWFDDVRSGVVERLVRLATLVPDGVEVGFHFCHGRRRPHLPHGRDVRTVVDVANDVVAELGRDVTWLHVPISSGRLEPEEFEPLLALRLPPTTELHLGVIEPSEGIAAARARIAAARRFAEEFGVATDCGWGDCAPSDLPGLLDLHAEVAADGLRATRIPTNH